MRAMRPVLPAPCSLPVSQALPSMDRAAVRGAPGAAVLPHTAATFTNPIVPAHPQTGSADPSVVFHDGLYHYCRSIGAGAVGVASTPRLQDIGRAPMVVVWRPKPGTAWSREVWAPELQRVQGRWMIYVAASDGRNRNHRMVALQAETDDPQGPWRFCGKVAAPTDRWAIDGIVVEQGARLYFVWSGWRHAGDGFPQRLYIAPMSDPWTICGERRELAAPLHAWERRGASLLEAPAVLYAAGQVFLAYSASGSWTDHYAIGLLRFRGGDMLDPAAWERRAEPAFVQRPCDGVFGPGHNCFVQSPDGRETWAVYHAIDRAGGGWLQRSVRAQPIGWTPDGWPDLGLPAAPGAALTEPSGTPRLSPADEARLVLAVAARQRPPAMRRPRAHTESSPLVLGD